VISKKHKRDYVEELSGFFRDVGGWSFDHRAIVLTVCAAMLVATGYFASLTRFDNSFQAYFSTGDRTYEEYLRFRDDFGSDELAYILYEAPDEEHGPFDLEVMRKIAALTRALEEEVPFVKKVTSLTNVEYIEGVEDGVEIYDLLEEFPETQEELLAVREKALRKQMYIGNIVNADATYAAIVLETERSSIDPLEDLRLDPEGGDGLENLYPQVTYFAIEDILARPEYEGIVFHHVGDVALNSVYNGIIGPEAGWLGLITFVVIGVLLAFFFRRPVGVLGPFAVVILSMMVSFATAGVMGWNLDLMVIMLPTLMIAVGVADSVHLISEFRALHAELGDRREAARQSLYLVGTPCLLTSLTTAAGFASMSIAPIKAISHFAVYAAIGVLAAFFLSVTVLFVFLSFGRRTHATPATEERIARAKGGRRVLGALAAVARFDVTYRKPILYASGAIFAFSLFGIARLTVDSNFLTEFDRQEPIRVATEFADEIMGGSGSFVYVFDTGEPEGIKDPEVLREVERLQNHAEANGGLVKKTTSIVDILKDLNQSFNEDDPAYYVLPETREMIGQFLLVYEMSGGEEIADFVTGDFSRTNLEVRTKLKETSVMRQIPDDLAGHLADQPVVASELNLTGMGSLWLAMEKHITTSQIRGFALALAVIAALLCFVFRSIRLGMIAMVPNLAPVIVTLGAMGWLGIPLDYVRLLIASVAIGISVDDTIHHVTRFDMEYRRTGSYERALHSAMVEVGRALVITSVVLVVGFLVFLFSRLDTLQTFGLLLSGTIVTALIADFVLMPALVLTVRPLGEEPEAEVSEAA
jgi:predicted RND superfamily exporter protein